MFENMNIEDMEKMVKLMKLIKDSGLIGDSKEVVKDTNTKNNESKVNLIDTTFDEEAQWEKVLENRKNNPELRFLKNEGRTATEEDLNDILKKLNGGKAMTNEDIDNVLKKYYKEEVDE